MALPNDSAIAAFVKDGSLYVISGRGLPWKYDPSKEKDPDKCPSGFTEAFANGDRLYVLDSSDCFWEYNHADGTWKEGAKLGDGVNQEDESPWVSGSAITLSTPEEEDDSGSPGRPKKKSKQHEDA